MKGKRLWKFSFLGLLMMLLIACFMAFSACDKGEKPNENIQEWTYDSVYAQAQSLGYEGTLEEFIALISGEDGADGVGITRRFTSGLWNTLTTIP